MQRGNLAWKPKSGKYGALFPNILEHTIRQRVEFGGQTLKWYFAPSSTGQIVSKLVENLALLSLMVQAPDPNGTE
jgi:hypothetical protein